MSFYHVMAIITMIIIGTALAVFNKRSGADTDEPITWVFWLVVTVLGGCFWPITLMAVLIGGCIYFLYNRINKWLDSRGNKDAS